jgi:hypothetical protein
MSISDDEKEAREWLALVIRSHSTYESVSHLARTTLALLDRPVMPRPEDVPEGVLTALFWAASPTQGTVVERGRVIYRELYAALTKREPLGWGIKAADGTLEGAFIQRSDAERYLQRHSGSRIVRLVEATDD